MRLFTNMSQSVKLILKLGLYVSSVLCTYLPKLESENLEELNRTVEQHDRTTNFTGTENTTQKDASSPVWTPVNYEEIQLHKLLATFMKAIINYNESTLIENKSSINHQNESSSTSVSPKEIVRETLSKVEKVENQKAIKNKDIKEDKNEKLGKERIISNENKTMEKEKQNGFMGYITAKEQSKTLKVNKFDNHMIQHNQTPTENFRILRNNKPQNIKLTTAVTSKERLIKVCLKFEHSRSMFHVNSLADIWQTVYYALPQKIHCFKIHIKKVSFEEKVRNELTYGNFSGKVDWKKCNLEVRATTIINKKHYLQGGDEDYGVLKNIIIEKRQSGVIAEFQNQEPTYYLVDEDPDQWLVYRNLLVMRDCRDAGIVMFSRVPLTPGQMDIKEALNDFGVTKMDGKLACYEKETADGSSDEDDAYEPHNK